MSLTCRPAVWIFAATVASLLLAEPSAPSIAEVRVFAVYEPVFNRQDVELLSRVHPDFVCRGWFKWHNTPDWQSYAPLAQACRDKGILLQGGITLAALYPGENGMDEATFRDFSCHGTDGQPFHCRYADSGGWYHLSLYNPKVIDTLKREVRLQIDAGAIGIWYDEIEGYYDWNPTEGYDPYACAAFRDWLIRKYCAGQNWDEDDPRWLSQFGIDLSKHGGSMRTFDYLRHLQTSPGKDGTPLATNPSQGHPRAWATSSNPLFREWGFAWDRKAQGTFRFDTVAAIFLNLLADADRYAREKYGRTLLSTYNHNGTARPGVAFLQPHNGAQPTLRKNRLDGRASYLDYYEKLIADAAEICPGQPVVFFVDWPGETDRLTALPRSDQTHFFATYIPEAYAAGGEFALPLRGYRYLSAHQGTLAYLARLADFYRDFAPWLRGSRATPVQPDVQDRLTVRARSSGAGTAVHIINHAFSVSDVWPLPHTNLCVTLPWAGPSPASAFAVSPDFPEQRPVKVRLKDGSLTLDVGTVTCSALVLLPSGNSLRPVEGSAAHGTHILDPQGRALAVARNGRFTLWLPSTAAELECLETGERQPARDSVGFTAPPSGDLASGLLLDTFGIPARHSTLASGSRRWHTDAWGRFRVPLSQASGGQLSACVENGTTNTLVLNSDFTAWRVCVPRRSIGNFSAGTDGYWANWPDKERVPGAISLSRDEHLNRPSLKCVFSPAPRVPWSNVNSPGFAVSDANAVELVYAGDGTPRKVSAVLHASQRFYRFPLSLAAKDWTTCRIAFSEFRDDSGKPFDRSVNPGNIAFQFAPAGLGNTPATLWAQSLTLVNDTPVKHLWQSTNAFDDVDVENLCAEHRPQEPPPAIAARQPLVRSTDAAPRLLANWDGKGPADAKPLVVIERVAPQSDSPFLRVTLPAGECSWGNANIPLPAAKLQGQDGLVLRLRVKPSFETVALALHKMSRGQQEFYHADAEAPETWTDLVLPWSEFRTPDGRAFAPAPDSSVNLQICRPTLPLIREIVIEIGLIDCFTKKEKP